MPSAKTRYVGAACQIETRVAGHHPDIWVSRHWCVDKTVGNQRRGLAIFETIEYVMHCLLFTQFIIFIYNSFREIIRNLFIGLRVRNFLT